jgi:hypothetical protein
MQPHSKRRAGTIAVLTLTTVAGATLAQASGWETPTGYPPGPGVVAVPVAEEAHEDRFTRNYLYKTPPTKYVPYLYSSPITGRARLYLHPYRTYRR